MRTFFRRIFQFGHFVGAATLTFFACLALLGYAFPLLDALNHFQPFWFVGTLTFLLSTGAFFKSGRMRALMTTLCATGFMASAIVVVPEATASLLPRDSLPSSETRTYKLLTYNIFGMNYDADRVNAMIADQAPDIIVLQEYFPYQRSFLHPVLVKLYPYFVFCEGEKRGNIALYAREGFAPLGPEACQWDADRRTARIAGAFAPRDGAAFTVMTTHLDWPIQISPLWQSASLSEGVTKMTARQVGQYNDLTDAAAKINGPLIVAGDFNSTSWSYALRRFVTHNRLTRHTRNLFTFPMQFFVFGWRETPGILPLDQVLSRDGIQVHDLYTASAAGSDHAPVVTIFSVKN